MGDLGGVLELIAIIVGIAVSPYSEHSFILKALQKLYLARTRTTGLFIQPKQKKLKHIYFD